MYLVCLNSHSRRCHQSPHKEIYSIAIRRKAYGLNNLYAFLQEIHVKTIYRSLGRKYDKKYKKPKKNTALYVSSGISNDPVCGAGIF